MWVDVNFRRSLGKYLNTVKSKICFFLRSTFPKRADNETCSFIFSSNTAQNHFEKATMGFNWRTFHGNMTEITLLAFKWYLTSINKSLVFYQSICASMPYYNTLKLTKSVSVCILCITYPPNKKRKPQSGLALTGMLWAVDFNSSAFILKVHIVSRLFDGKLYAYITIWTKH